MFRELSALLELGDAEEAALLKTKARKRMLRTNAKLAVEHARLEAEQESKRLQGVKSRWTKAQTKASASAANDKLKVAEQLNAEAEAEVRACEAAQASLQTQLDTAIEERTMEGWVFREKQVFNDFTPTWPVLVLALRTTHSFRVQLRAAPQTNFHSLTPQVNCGSLYRCGKSTFNKSKQPISHVRGKGPVNRRNTMCSLSQGAHRDRAADLDEVRGWRPQGGDRVVGLGAPHCAHGESG